ncbi:hypothetical protein HY310_00565 [Candidatus Microgenomates bacterium]|nr:hypothetical protein [Candidatus Microgenomates bacterium]
MDIDKLKLTINNEPLIKAGSSIATINQNLLEPGGSIFFGVGIVSSKQLSVAMPFDILAMFFITELLRRRLQKNKVIVLIADDHARSNNMWPEEKIMAVCNQTRSLLGKIIRNLNLDGFELKLASEIIIDETLPNFDNAYLKREIADVKFFQKTEHLKLKIGWAMGKNGQIEGHDERFFDEQIIKFCPDLSLIHLGPGHTFDQNRPRVSPYLSIDNEQRILLNRNECVDEKIRVAKSVWHDPSLGGAIGHMADIVKLAENLFGKIHGITLEEKVQNLINIVIL